MSQVSHVPNHEKGIHMTEQLYDQSAYEPDPVVGEYVPPTVHILATYPPGVPGCPDSMTVDLNIAADTTLGLDIRAAVQALASVGMFARAGDR
jgi:hypothetical protein